MLTFTQGYRKDLAYPNRLKETGAFYGYGHPTKPKLPATRDWHDIRAILVHTTNNPKGNTAYPSEARFLRDASNVSIHYVVSSHDQTIVEVLPPAFIAWHAGDCLDNDYENITSIGIEIAWTPAAGALPQIAIDNVTRLVKQLLDWYPWITKIDMHRSQAIPKGRKQDPSGWSDKDFYTWRAGIFGSAAPTQPASGLLTERSTLFGPTLANKDKVIAEILKRGSAYGASDVRVIVDTTFRLCATVDVPAEIIIGQQFVETSAQADADPELEPFSSAWALRHNLSGIGVTGTPGAGVVFPSLIDTIQAQIGRLLRYFLKDGVGTEAQQTLMSTALHWRPLDKRAWGSCTQLKHLGAVHNPANAGLPHDKWFAGWAWDGPTYGQHIADVANMLRGL